jgi:hypothetical protein
MEQEIEKTVADAPEGADRRQSRRFEVDASVQVLVLDHSLLFQGQILDVSSTGCYIRTKAHLRLPVNSRVEVIFWLRKKRFRVPSEFMFYKTKVGAGFRFLAMGEAIRTKIDLLLVDLDVAGSADGSTAGEAINAP